MRLKGRLREIVIVVVPEQGPYIALVVDLNSLLLLRLGMRAGLEHEPVDGSEYQELPRQRHICGIASARIQRSRIVAQVVGNSHDVISDPALRMTPRVALAIIFNHLSLAVCDLVSFHSTSFCRRHN